MTGRVELRRRYEYYKYVSTACPVTYANDMFQSHMAVPMPDTYARHTPVTHARHIRQAYAHMPVTQTSQHTPVKKPLKQVH